MSIFWKAYAYSIKTIMALLLIIITTLAASNSYAKTEDSLVNFNLEQQSADTSIITFAQQADITLLFPHHNLENITTNKVFGWYRVSQGLAVLLARTGLKAEMDKSGQFSIVIDDEFRSQQIALRKAQKKQKNAELTANNAPTSVDKITKQSLQVNAKHEIEVITVSGVRGSIVRSLNDKRFSTEIKETISAEDIGQLPDENIAEALQRITGIQMTRSADGEGTSVQIRGISDNNVEINGQTISGSSADRSINFQDIPSELVSGIEVLKVATADNIEGSLGGTINLKTRRPLNIQEDQVGSVTAKVKYHQLSGQKSPDINGFLAKNFRDTGIGDFGFVFNFARKEVTSQTDVYGGGDWSEASAMWFRRSGGQLPAGNTANNQFLSSGPFQYVNGIDEKGYFAYGIDVNGDGIVNDKDSYYALGGIRTSSRYVESQRDSLNFTAQWQPNSSLNLYLDYSKANSAEYLHDSQMSLAFNAARSFPVTGMKHELSAIDSDIYLLESGLIGATNIRMGGAPAVRDTLRKSEKITLGFDYQLSDQLLVETSFSTSNGLSKSNQAQLNMGYDWDGDDEFSGSDWAGLVAYDLSRGTLPNASFYESPKHTLHGDQPTNFEELVVLDPSSISYEKLNYFQMQRNADDTNNEEYAFKFDITNELAGDFFSAIKVGTRIASRTYHHTAYINPNQKKNVVVDGLVKSIDIQEVNVNPQSNDLHSIQIANDLLSCLSSESIDVGDSNLPNNWTGTRCSSDFFTDYFAMHDIRATNPSSGTGYYENEGSRYDVTEDTRALYLKLDFFMFLSDMPLFGNVGVRYVETDTESSGYVQNEKVADEDTSFSWLTLPGQYQDTLPSININLGLNDEVIFRFAAYQAISRPSLQDISPGIDIKFSAELDGYAGTANLGNPNLLPILSQNIDLSYEWYYANDSIFSTALFYKNLDSVIFVDAAEKKPVEIGGKLFLATQPQNYNGTAIQGFELNLQHAFSHFSGIFSYTGIGINYTYTDEDSNNFDDEGDAIGRVGLSQHSYNLLTYYDDGTFSIRLAYNWRDDFVRRASVSLGYNRPETLPEIEKARGQLDLTANYSITDNFKVNFSAVNLNESKTQRYMKYEQLTNYIATSGAKYNFGVVYRF
jgi:iron complex outermembrane receptor protein